MALTESLIKELQDEGWSLDPQAVAHQLDLAGIPPPTTAAALRAAILNLDLKQVGASALPEDINRSDSRRLAGPHILQLASATDTSLPSLFQDGPSDRKGRMLRLKMTDGQRSCVGVEYAPVPALRADDLLPGVKLRIKGALVRVGVLLLDPKSIDLVGGRVDHLAEAWEAHQQFGGTAKRPRAAEGEAAERPPPFKAFDPKAGGRGAGQQQPQGRGGAKQGRGREGRGGGRGAPPPPSAPPAPVAPPPPPAVATPAPAPAMPSAARKKLLDRLAANEEEARGRGRGRGRRGRRRLDDDDDDDGSMTLEEWEAQQAAKMAGGGSSMPSTSSQMLSDEELARQLQRQLDMEDAAAHFGGRAPAPGHAPGQNLRSSLVGIMFSFGDDDEEQEDGVRGDRGRGRGRGRGRRGGGGGGDGRGRARGRGRGI